MEGEEGATGDRQPPPSPPPPSPPPPPPPSEPEAKSGENPGLDAIRLDDLVDVGGRLDVRGVVTRVTESSDGSPTLFDVRCSSTGAEYTDLDRDLLTLVQRRSAFGEEAEHAAPRDQASSRPVRERKAAVSKRGEIVGGSGGRTGAIKTAAAPPKRPPKGSIIATWAPDENWTSFWLCHVDGEVTSTGHIPITWLELLPNGLAYFAGHPVGSCDKLS